MSISDILGVGILGSIAAIVVLVVVIGRSVDSIRKSKQKEKEVDQIIHQSMTSSTATFRAQGRGGDPVR